MNAEVAAAEPGTPPGTPPSPVRSRSPAGADPHGGDHEPGTPPGSGSPRVPARCVYDGVVGGGGASDSDADEWDTEDGAHGSGSGGGGGAGAGRAKKGRRRPGPRRCGACDVEVSGSEGWQDHLNGKAHQKKAPGVVRHCVVCSLALEDEAEFRAHVLDAGHRAKQQGGVCGCQRWNLTPGQDLLREYGAKLRGAVRGSDSDLETAASAALLLDEIRSAAGEAAVPAACAQGNSSGKVALTNAAWAGKSETVRLLLAASASVNPLTIRGQTPLMIACSRNKPDTVRALLEHDGGRGVVHDQRVAKLKVRSVKGETALQLAEAAPMAADLLSALRERQTREVGGWVDFQSGIRARPHRRQAMLRFGTLIFSGPKQAADLAASANELFNFNPMGVNSISSGSPHVRPMWALSTCGEPGEIKKSTHPKNITALFREQDIGQRRGAAG